MTGDQVDVRRRGVACLGRHLDVGDVFVHDLGQTAAQGIVRPGHAARSDGEKRLIRRCRRACRKKKSHDKKNAEHSFQIEHPPLQNKNEPHIYFSESMEAS